MAKKVTEGKMKKWHITRLVDEVRTVEAYVEAETKEEAEEEADDAEFQDVPRGYGSYEVIKETIEEVPNRSGTSR